MVGRGREGGWRKGRWMKIGRIKMLVSRTSTLSSSLSPLDRDFCIGCHFHSLRQLRLSTAVRSKVCIAWFIRVCYPVRFVLCPFSLALQGA